MIPAYASSTEFSGLGIFLAGHDSWRKCSIDFLGIGTPREIVD